MKSNKAFLLVLLILSLFAATACTSSTSTPSNINQAVAVNVNSNVSAPTNAAVSPTAAVAPTPNAVGSPSATVTAYYQSMIRKDEAAFRKTLSQTTLREFAAGAREDGDPTLLAFHTGYSSPPSKPFQTRNERVSGDTAQLEVQNADTGVWQKWQLVRENGEWKLDLTEATTNELLRQTPGK